MIGRVYLPMLIFVSFLLYTIYSEDAHVTNYNDNGQNIVVYTTKKCVFCEHAQELLKVHDILYTDIDITSDQAQYKKLLKDTRQKSAPYIFVNNKFIGGYQELTNIIQNKNLSHYQN